RRPGRPARRARPAGPADRPASGRRAAGDLCLAVRGGAEGSDPADAGRGVRAGGHVPGDHHDLRRTPGGQRRGGRVHRPGRQVGLRVEPGPTGSGATFRLEVELGSMPYTFMRAVGETARRTLRQGLHGCEVIDCVVTLTHTGYWARQSHTHGSFGKSRSSTAGDFRGLTPLVLMDALKRAGTRVHEPLYRFHLELPAGLLGAVLPVL